MLKIILLLMGFFFSFLAAKFKLFSDDLQHRVGDWAVTYTLAFLTFLSIHPSGEVSEEYIVLFKSAAAIVTGLVLTIGKLVIEYLFNKYIKRKK